MSATTVYQVQSMRKFVCDCLTAAAQEILGAFEKKVEDYEAELARQRRMFDTVFSPEMKLQREGEEALLNQQHFGNNYALSRCLPETVHIKEEHEEMSICQDLKEEHEKMNICQDLPQPPQQQESTASTSTPASGPKSSVAQYQPLGPENVSGANKEPQANSSHKDVESESKEWTFLVSEKPLSQTSGEAETQHDDRGALPTEPKETTSIERSQGSATNPEEAFDDDFLGANYEDILIEIDGNPFEIHSMSPEPSLNISFDVLNITSARMTEQTQLEKDHVDSSMLMGSTELTQTINAEFTTPTASNKSTQTRMSTGDNKTSALEGHCKLDSRKIQDEIPGLTRAQPRETQDWRQASPILTVPTPVDESRHETPATTERVVWRAFITSNQDKSTIPTEFAELKPNDESRDRGATSAANLEKTSHKTNYEMSASLTKNMEQTLSLDSIRECMTPFGRTKDTSKKKQKEARTPVHKCTDPSSQTSTRSLRDGQSSESPQKRMRKGDGLMSARNHQIQKQDERSKEGTTSNQCPDPPLSNTDVSESSDGEEKVENPYKCDRCGKVMSNFKNYKFHMKSHTVPKTFKCETCGKMFRESWDLNKHMIIHSTEKPYKCGFCGNGFNRRYNLDLHVRVHTGEKPYVCKTCGKSFSSCVNMKKHMRIHTGEKPYTCKDCGKEFADSSAFKNHLRVHTGEKPFKCSNCKRKFATRTTLKRHIRTHTGEKPYKCTVCGRSFGHRTDLKGHMRMHTGEKPYKCPTCGEEFSTWSKLNKHKRVHSGEAQDSTE